jgi:membrane protein
MTEIPASVRETNGAEKGAASAVPVRPSSFMSRMLRNLRLALWRGFQHDAFGVAKGGAFSSILSLFPILMIVASILVSTRNGPEYVVSITDAAYRVLPPGMGPVVEAYFRTAQERPVGLLIGASLITLWTASGVMISWMVGFREAYQLPKTWGLVKERMIAFGLTIMAGIPLMFATILVAFGNQIEHRLSDAAGQELSPYLALLWMAIRWVIATATSISVMQLIYHNAVPRTLKWHTVLPGATLATALWFPTTLLFGYYVRHFAAYSLFYGSLATPIVLLIWLYIMSIIVLIGAEFNALVYPRAIKAKEGESYVVRNP